MIVGKDEEGRGQSRSRSGVKRASATDDADQIAGSCRRLPAR